MPKTAKVKRRAAAGPGAIEPDRATRGTPGARPAGPPPVGPCAGGPSQAARAAYSGGSGNSGHVRGTDPGGVDGAISEIAAYPVLTEEIGYPPSPLARPAGMPAPGSGMPALGQTALKAISDVLGWQVKPDPKAFLGALNASVSLKEVGGRTEATWTPRTYAVQTDLSGGITGAQASVYKRAKDALDQSLPLLDGLYGLFEEAKPEDMEALRATVRSQFTDLVDELGRPGGPRISRVTQLFSLLLGQQLPPHAGQVTAFMAGGGDGPLATDPDQISGSLGTLRQEFGLSMAADQVNTVEDEQNVTNFRIVSDYLTSLAQSWLNNLQFFGLGTPTPFFGTQLVLLSRQLSVVAEKTNEVRFTLDSVFIGPADRQTLQIHFPNSPNPSVPRDPPMFLEDLLTWIDSFASEEGPRLIAEGGKFAVGQSFGPIAQQLQRLVQGLLLTARDLSMPPGFRTSRVRNSLQDLADALQQLVSLAAPISHVITPEPEPPLAVLGLNPNVLFLGLNALPLTITIIGTGFDIGIPTTLDTSSTPPPKTPGLNIFSPGLGFEIIGPLSSNLIAVKLTQITQIDPAPQTANYAVIITVTNRNLESATLVTNFTVLQTQ